MGRSLTYSFLCLSALWLMVGCVGNKAQMLRQLEVLEQQNRNDEPMLNDSLAESLVAYFDRHGDANERMRARYILGRTYADMGDSPKAMDAYNKAEDCAEVGSNQCDFKTLGRIHGQKAVILREQYLPQEAAKEFDKATACAMMDKDSLFALICKENKIVTFYQLGLDDSLLMQTKEVFHGYLKRKEYEYAANSIVSAVKILLQHGDIEKAKYYIDFYGKYSSLQENSNKKKATHSFFLGLYHFHINNLDSSIFYFRKEMEYSRRLNDRIRAYHGLFKAYQMQDRKDSAAKYAEYYSIANDSSNVFESANRIQQMQSLYNYERSQREAMLNKEIAEHNRNMMWLSVCIGFAILYIVILHYRKSQSDDRNRMISLNVKYNSILEAYTKAKEDKVLYESKRSEYARQKEKEIEYYKNLLQKYETFNRVDDERDSVLSENPLLQRLHRLASKGKVISDEELEELFALIDRVYPSFFKEINRLSDRLTYKQKSLCALTKLYFIPAEIGSLLDMRYQSVTNMRSRLAKTLFGVNSDTRDFDNKIHTIS